MLHTVSVPANQVAEMAERTSQALDSKHQWYADYKSDSEHYIIYCDKIFHVTDRVDASQYDAASRYGTSAGISGHQVDFSSHVLSSKA